MKTKSRGAARPTKRPTEPTMPVVIRRPLTHPTPVQDELMKRFGPKHPTRAGTII